MEIVGVGNALMDIVAPVDEDFAPSLGFQNDSTVHLDHEGLERVLSRLERPAYSAGGGAANVVRIASILGLGTSFAGAVGPDEFGRRYRAELGGVGVRCAFVESPGKTGVFCALLRPGGKRTILVAPGAALDLTLEPPPLSLLVEGRLLFVEGFLLHDRAWFLELLGAARRAGMEIALDLGSAGLVRANREFLLALVPAWCDLVFANEDEFLALAGLPLEEGLSLFSESGAALVVKRAERGALYVKGGERRESPVRSLVPVDATGAGDAFAAGFLAGLAQGLAPERCLRLGNRIAEEVLMVPGIAADPARIRAAGGSVGA